jgi:ABC-type polysaccharide/polyol phosphate export permease
MGFVVASLLFMYGYGTDVHSIGPMGSGLLAGASKAGIFYAGLGIFGVFNLLMNWGIKIYREADGFDGRSFLFRNEFQKAKLLVWLTLSLAAINFFISAIVAYIGFIKIDGTPAERQYIYLPVLGALVLIVTISGLAIALFTRQKT